MSPRCLSILCRRALFTSALEDIEGGIWKSSGSEFYSHYELEQLVTFRLDLIERSEGSAAAREFLQSQVHLDRLRKILIERSITEGKLDEAMNLIQAGITSSEERRLPGPMNQYRALRVNLLQTKGDNSILIDAARTLWLDSGDEATFTLLKQAVSTVEWAAFVDGLVKDIRRTPEQLAWPYARENRWRDLMTLVQSRQQSSWLLESYREQLESNFPEEITLLYEKLIDQLLVVSANRTGYKQVVAYLCRRKKLGQAARANALAQRIRTQYANRPALLDELSQL